MTKRAHDFQRFNGDEERFFGGADKLQQAEEAYIRKKRGDTKNHDALEDLSALAISGGGIRSASFALGVMQSLAKHRVLEKFDYLSTVSGGGYIGSSLTWLLSGKGRKSSPDQEHEYGLTDTDFPYREQTGKPDSLLAYLRGHGNYLTPGAGLGKRSLLAALLRSILLNLIVWIPLIVGSFVALRWLAQRPAVAHVLRDWAAKPILGLMWDPLYLGGAVLALLAAGVFVLLSVLYSLATGVHRNAHGWWNPLRTVHRYLWRRWFERVVGGVLAILFLGLVVASVPVVENHLADWVGAAGGWLAVLGGVWSSLSCHASTSGSDPSSDKIPLAVKASVGAGLFLYGLLLVSYQLALAVFPYDAISAGPKTVLLVALAVSVLTGYIVNLNYISLHRMYRDRLMEAFMPSVANARANKTAAAKEADGVRMSDALDPKCKGPYHIINNNVITVDSRDSRLRQRGGDSFILSPRYCGSAGTGWESTHTFMGNGMTLPTAMAISGAAANPNAGVGGGGVSRNRLVSKLMLLLNIGLGYWCLKPRQRSTFFNRVCRYYHFQPRHFTVGISAFWRHILREDHRYIQLTDGGHFENLALYEMIRRKVRMIVVCDGGADPDFSFGDLQNALARIKEDFGVSIDFRFNDAHGAEALAKMIPTGQSAYPQQVKTAETGFILGDIHYPGGADGLLVFLKTTLPADLDLQILGYRAEHPEFPDQSTADQFFDPSQFDAYRLLGNHIGASLFEHEELRRNETWAKLRTA